MRKYIVSVLVTAVLYNFTGCSSSPSCCVIVPPNPVITGEKTVIERQIVGEYRELEKDAWMVSSVRTTAGKKNLSGKMAGDQELFTQMKVREFHSERIREYKDEGAVGEGNDGYLHYIMNGKYESSSDEKKILVTLLDEENRARRAIFVRSIDLSKGKEPEKVEIDSFGKIFAEEQRGLALKDDWVQGTSGKWERKR